MAIETRILGKRGADNAIFVTINTGQHISRLLMDCGENTVSELSFSDSSQIDHVLFSHYHMDHVAGFDTFFRRHYDRHDRLNHIWGPPGTIEIKGHRFRSFIWNLIGGRQSRWLCHDIFTDHVTSARYELAEAFTQCHIEDDFTSQPTHLFHGPGYQVEALTLNHGIPTIGYLVREADRINIDTSKLQELGLKPGPWLKTLGQEETCIVNGIRHDAEPLRQALLVRTPGDSIAFLTDFIAEPGSAEQDRIADRLQGITTLICECQYRASDFELARKNYHMTTSWVGQLAALIKPRRLLLTHFSERYQPNEWDEMIEEVREIFPSAQGV